MTHHFLRLFLPSALLLGLLITALQYHSHAIARQGLLASQTHNVELVADAINRDVEVVTDDLRTLARSGGLRRFMAAPSAESRQAAEQELAAFAHYKRLYADISYISLDGEVRLSASKNGAVQPPHPTLLTTAQRLPADAIAVSPLTLTTDAANRPQPVFQFAMPVRDADQDLHGVLIATYDGPHLLTSLNRLLAQEPGTEFLIASDGEWLQHTGLQQGWALPSTERFADAYPDAWQHMLAADAGQFRTEQGLFTFTTIHPPDLAGSQNRRAGQFWKIGSYIDKQMLAAAVLGRVWRAAVLYLLLLIPVAIVCRRVGRLVRARQRSDRRIRELGAVVEQSHDLVLITDAEGRIRYTNPRFTAITGYSRAEVIGRTPALLRSGRHDEAFYRRLWDTIRRGEAFESVIVNRKKNGELFHLQMTISPLSNAAGISGYVATGKDITGQVQSQERLLKLAFHHPLTGLPNRALFRDHLHEAAVRARRGGHHAAVLFIDLDRFKKVNDSLGHQAGDELLKQVAQRLRGAVREMDTVAHLGGDEFTVLLDDIQQPAQVQSVATKLLQLFDLPFTVSERELYIGASIGIAIFPDDSDNVEKLMEQADTAMYQAKRSGRGRYQFYSADMTTLAHARLELENRLRTALPKREFELHFQPIVDPGRRRLRGLEALIRWRQPDGSLYGPMDFIPVLEETGLITPVTAWVLEEACRQCRRLHDMGVTGLRINVNISSQSFYQDGLVDAVSGALERTGLAAGHLVLEVTESLLLEDQVHVQQTLEALRRLGVAIAIDDFGTGYSSLAYLRRLPVDILKIDRSFIVDVGRDERDAALVSAMLAMAQELHLDVVAEGVEQWRQLDFLRQRHCNGAQGFLFSAPLPAERIHAHLHRDRDWPWQSWMNSPEASQLH